MMPWYFVLSELLIYAFAILIALHAWRGGSKWFCVFIAASCFGFLLEWLSVRQHTNYCYGGFMVMMPPWGSGGPPTEFCPEPDKVPLWITLGWGLTVYVAMRTTSRLDVPWGVRPVIDAILAVNVDWIMDPLAAKLHFWHWQEGGPWFGVPIDNYFGWIVTVGSFSFFVRLLWRVIPAWKRRVARDGVLSCATVVAASLSVFGLMMTYKYLAAQGVPERLMVAVSFALAALVIAPFAWRVRGTHAPDYLLIGIAVFFQVYYFIGLWASGMLGDHPVLVLVCVVTLLIAIFGYSWPYDFISRRSSP